MSIKARRSIFSVIPVMVLVVILIVLFSSFSISAGESSDENRTKYFTTLTVEDGDSLWSIATEYKSNEYSNISDYIDEVMSINNLETDLIKKGETIIIPYYSEEDK